EDGEYAVYYVNITNTGLANSSVPITARLTSSCTTADLVIYSSTQIIDSPIEASSSALVNWTVRAVSTATDCEVKLNVSGGRWWSSASEKIMIYTINITNSSSSTDTPEAEEQEDTTTTDTVSTDSECSSSFDCADDELCTSDHLCVKISCAEGKVAKNHRCVVDENYTVPEIVEEVTSIKFVGNYSDMLVERGSSVVIEFNMENDGDKDIDRLLYYLVVNGVSDDNVVEILNYSDILAVGNTAIVKYNITMPDDAASGYHDATIFVSYGNSSVAKTVRLKVSFSDADKELIEKDLGLLKKEIETLEKSVEKIIGSNDGGVDIENLNDSLSRIKELYEEARVAVENGDYFTASEKKAMIDSLILDMMDESPEVADSLNGSFLFNKAVYGFIIVIISVIVFFVYKYEVYKRVDLNKISKMHADIIEKTTVLLNKKTSRKNKGKVKAYLDREKEEKKFFKEQEKMAKEEMKKLKGESVKREVLWKPEGYGKKFKGVGLP
ncbi:MAG: hypothetical protein KAJ54_03295, partial [Candidatus Aenigmarchaeota archaeon]|nr:hypothetical protein [Candidatus Aenigmarchaeota archaeon]